MTINSCQEKMNVISERILNRIYQIKSPIQSSNWNHLDIDEKLEQLIDINDTLFEQIVSEFNVDIIIISFLRHLLLISLMELKHPLFQQ
jgi:hypothetical protein